MSHKHCRECSLDIRLPFKQVVQIDDEVCEECHIAVLGAEEFPDDINLDSEE
jgi:hypothetical protein